MLAPELGILVKAGIINGQNKPINGWTEYFIGGTIYSFRRGENGHRLKTILGWSKYEGMTYNQALMAIGKDVKDGNIA